MTPNRKYITKLVKQRGWSDSELAKHMRVSRAEANRFMKGERTGGKKLISGLIRAFPDESLQTLFSLPISSPIVNEVINTVTKRELLNELVSVKNLNNALVAKMNVATGLIEVVEHGYTTQFKVPPGTDIQVINLLPPPKNTT